MPHPKGTQELQELGKYRILKFLGAGAMGEVYLGEHKFLEAWHALKVLPPAAYEEQGFQERLRAEARIMAKLQHPNIVRVHDLDWDNASGTYFLAMDYIAPDKKDPQTLENLLTENNGRLPWKR